MRSVPPQNLRLIQYFEQGPSGGPALTAYRDPAGYLTVGYGHRCAAPTTLTPEAALTLAQADLDVRAAFVCQCLGPQITASLSDGQFATLIDFCFNEGVDQFAHSTLHALVMQGRFDLVPHELMKWVYAHVDGKPVVEPGLVKRREAEATLWSTGSWGPPA